MTRFCFLLAFVAPIPLPAATPPSGPPNPSTFRWVHASSDPVVWERILTAFNDELTPDQRQPDQDERDVYGYKYIQKVGVVNDSALVIIGHRPAKETTKENSWNQYHSAFNFDLSTGRKSPVEHAEWMWDWKFGGVAKFDSSSVPDVTFTYASCTECEAAFVLASLYYDPASSSWKLRPWEKSANLWWIGDDGLVVDEDTSASDTISFDCVYGKPDLAGKGFTSLVVRCKELAYVSESETKLSDHTVVFGVRAGKFKGREVTDFSEVAALTQKICNPKSKSQLCTLPGYMTITAGQNDALKEMFPNGPPLVREIKCFQNLQPTTSVMQIVNRCGRPDELGGSGILIFIFHLDDGSLVTIGTTGLDTPIMYGNYSDPTGKGSDLLLKK